MMTSPVGGTVKDARTAVLAVPQRQREHLEFSFAATVEEAIRGTLAKHTVKGFTLPG
jgi:uncharacterized membrane protein YqiK